MDEVIIQNLSTASYRHIHTDLMAQNEAASTINTLTFHCVWFIVKGGIRRIYLFEKKKHAHSIYHSRNNMMPIPLITYKIIAM